MHLKERLTTALHIKWVRLLLILILPFFMAALAASADYYCYRGRIYPGVYFNDLPLGGMKLTDAEAKLEKEFFSMKRITFIGVKEKPRTFALTRLGVAWDRQETMAAITDAGTGYRGYPGRVQRLLGDGPLSIKGRLKVQNNKLDRVFDGLAKKVEKHPRDATLEVKGARVTIIEDRAGRTLLKDKLKQELFAALHNGRSEVALPLKSRPAGRTAGELAAYGIDNVMAAFTTTITPALPGRVHNIKLGAEAINGTLLFPGELFSFEALVGEITRAKGYREAPVIVGEELRPGLGGGLCQVSSTLYNAALLGNLEIVERLNHSQTIGYLPIGRDATISIGSVDLKFRNSRDHPVLIGAEVSGEQLTFRLFGPPMAEKVEIRTSDIVRLEPPVRTEECKALAGGEKKLLKQGKAGYTVKTWRIIYRRGKEVSRELLSHDRYRPTTTIYRIGIGPTADESEDD
ncbi:MAG: VanW family protein [Dethiobacteria bacterium]